jgi:hypothetical protein
MTMSAIDYAIHYKYPEAALAMVTDQGRAHEVMSLKSDKHPCVTLALIASMPSVFEAVQDKCITKANCKKDSKSFYVSFCQIFIEFSFCTLGFLFKEECELKYFLNTSDKIFILMFTMSHNVCTNGRTR